VVQEVEDQRVKHGQPDVADSATMTAGLVRGLLRQHGAAQGGVTEGMSASRAATIAAISAYSASGSDPFRRRSLSRCGVCQEDSRWPSDTPPAARSGALGAGAGADLGDYYDR
jgi:hypothetical protein